MKMQTYPCRFWILAALFLSVVSANADPIEMPEKPVTPEITFLISCAILLEVVCIWSLLLAVTETMFLHPVAYRNAPTDVPRVSGGSLADTRFASGLCRGYGRGTGGVGRGNLDLSDLPLYPTGQTRISCTINYQVSVCITAWQCPFGGSVPGFSNDL